jgi:hypothetical protein
MQGNNVRNIIRRKLGYADGFSVQLEQSLCISRNEWSRYGKNQLNGAIPAATFDRRSWVFNLTNKGSQLHILRG